MKVTRRRVLQGAAASAIPLGGAQAFGPTFLGGGSSGGGGGGLPALTAEITFPGGSPTASTLVYDIANGTDIGSYVAPTAGFTQRCIRVRHATLANFFVDFRPDSSGGRIEVVFWNGEVDPGGLTVTSGYTRNLPAYNAVVKNAGSAVYSLSLPFHYWGCRWRYQSAVRAQIRTASQIFSENWLPPMSQTAGRITGNNTYSGAAYSTTPVIQPTPTTATPATNSLTGSPTWTPFDPPEGNRLNYTLAAPLAAGATSMTLSNAVGSTDHVSVQLTNGMWQTFTITSNGTTVNIFPAAASGASNGAAAKLVSSCFFAFPINNDSGGNHPEEGIVSDFMAEALLYDGVAQGTKAYNSMMKHAECFASEHNAHYLPDLVSHAAVNYKQDVAHYKAYTRGPLGSGYGSYYLMQGGGVNSLVNNAGSEHMASWYYIPYALTEDPYFIEAQQFLHQFDKGFDIYGRENGVGHLASDPTGASGVCGTFTTTSYAAEPRNIGWGVRNTACAWKLAPTSPPSWLLPKSYYSSIAADEAKWIDLFLTQSTDVLQTVFFNPCLRDFVQAFETSYFIQSMSLAHLISCPHGISPTWLSVATYFFGQIDALTNGTSGWNRQAAQITNQDESTGVTKYSNADVSGYRTWGGAWTGASAQNPTFYTGGPLAGQASPANIQATSSTQNLSVMVGATACAKSVGVSAATAAKTFLDQSIDRTYPDALVQVPFEYRWAFTGA